MPTQARQAEFYEPSGLSIADGKLYIADTNNHAIRVADLETGRVSTLQITGLSEGPDRRPDYVWPNLEELSAAPQTVRSGRTSLTVNVEIPPPFKLNPGSPLEYQVELKRRDSGRRDTDAGAGRPVSNRDSARPVRGGDRTARGGRAGLL